MVTVVASSAFAAVAGGILGIAAVGTLAIISRTW